MHNNNSDEPNGLHEEKQQGKWGLLMNQTLSLINCSFKEPCLPASFCVRATYTACPNLNLLLVILKAVGGSGYMLYNQLGFKV